MIWPSGHILPLKKIIANLNVAMAENMIYRPPDEAVESAWIRGNAYDQLYQQSLADPDGAWGNSMNAIASRYRESYPVHAARSFLGVTSGFASILG